MSADAEWQQRTVQFEDLFRAHAATVRGFAAVRVGTDEADEVVAEVFHAAVIAYRSGRADQVTPAWLIAVAKNKIIDRWRRSERRMAKAHLVHRRGDAEFPDDWSHDHRRDAVLAALAELNPRHRSLLVLFHVDGMSVAEIALSSGDTPRSIESALSRARKRFREVYDADATNWRLA